MDDCSLHCLWLGAAGKALQRVNTAVSDNFDPLQINFTVVPATVLFALPGIRSLMPSIPGFGTYLDMVTILLCETIVGLCFVVYSLAVSTLHGSTVSN